jgi:hypothetical protein
MEDDHPLSDEERAQRTDLDVPDGYAEPQHGFGAESWTGSTSSATSASLRPLGAGWRQAHHSSATRPMTSRTRSSEARSTHSTTA